MPSPAFARPRWPALHPARVAMLLGLLTFLYLWSNLEVYPSPNAFANVMLAYAFVTDGSAVIGDVQGIPPEYSNWNTTSLGPGFNRFAPGTAVALAPAVGAAVALGARPADVVVWTALDKLVASLLVAAAASITYLAARRAAGDGPAVAATIALVAGTSIATVAGQRSWQHALGVVAVVAAWWCLTRGAERGSARDEWTGRSGLALAVSVTARYSNAVFWLVALGYVALARRRSLLSFLGWSAGPFAFLLLYNAVVFGSPSQLSYAPQLWQWAGLEGLAGNLLSPSRGVLVYSPAIAVALWLAARRALGGDRLSMVVLAWFAGALLVHGIYIEWWGGYSYGNRYLVEALPAFAPALALACAAASPRARVALGVVIAFGVALQAAGILAYYHFWDGYNWDAAREPEGPTAMWDPLDPQWLWTVRAALAQLDMRAAIAAAALAGLAALATRATAHHQSRAA